MPFDGSAWNEGSPTNSDLANEIDDYMRDIKAGVSGRMAQEHIWPSSQVATAEAGLHRYITLQAQTGAPGLTVGTLTQMAAIWASSGSKNVLIENSAGASLVIYNSSANALNITSGVYSSTGTRGEIIIGTTGGQIQFTTAGTNNQILHMTTAGLGAVWASNSAMMSVTNYATSAGGGTAVSNTNCKIYFGQATLASGTADLSGFGFANATSWAIGVVRFTAGDVSQAIQISSQSATGCKLRDSLNTTNIVNWLAVGT